MSNYDPRCTYLQGRSNIDKAYRLAGLKPPTTAEPVTALLDQQPRLDEVLTAVAEEALTPGVDAARWFDDALGRVRDAQACDALRSRFAATLEVAEHELLPALRDRAAADLAKAVAKSAKALAAAVAKLPTKGDPLDMSAIVDLDATKEWRAAQAALQDLAVYASIHETRPPENGESAQMMRLTPIVAMPEAVVEIVQPAGIDNWEAINRSETKGTRTLRNLSRGANRDGLDATLINVARGQYHGVSIALAGATELTERYENLERAFTRRKADQFKRPGVLVTF